MRIWSENLQLPCVQHTTYKFDQFIMVEIVIIFKMVIILKMVIMVEMRDRTDRSDI